MTEHEKTNIVLSSNNIYIKYEKITSFTDSPKVKQFQQEKNTNLNNIDYLKLKKEKDLRVAYIISMIIFIFMFTNKIPTVKNHIDLIRVIIASISVASLFLLFLIPGIHLTKITNTPDREILIKFKDNEIIKFLYCSYGSNNRINELISDLKESKNDIKVKNERLM